MVVQEEKFNYGVLLDTAETIFINIILKSTSMFLRLLKYIHTHTHTHTHPHTHIYI